MRAILKYFIKNNNNIEKNLKEYEQKKKAEQQESKILGQKPIKRTTNKKEKTNV
tara:strand:+ start:658 stop:819 length:162 start_codon:yes stop_codon:yes gene_type:complete